MTARPVRNVPASVRQRLLNLARSQGVPFNGILQRYTAERFPYRLGASEEVERFTLKGAALLRVWTDRDLRATRDVDFLASGRDDHSTIRAALEAICSTPCPEDGVFFDIATMRLDDIRHEQQYSGMRARIQGTLGQARLNLQVDIGFGDVITPQREEQDYPTLIDLPVPRLWTYPRETLIAEKFEAMVRLGVMNTRMKDLWDIACLARLFAYDGVTLRTAMAETFRRRSTSFDGEPVALSPPYYADDTRARLWESFKRHAEVDSESRTRLTDVGEDLRLFLAPVYDSLTEQRPFKQVWPAGGPWRPMDSDADGRRRS